MATALVAQTVPVGVTPVKLFGFTTSVIAVDVTTPAKAPQSRVWLGSDNTVAPGKGLVLPQGAKVTLDCSAAAARDGAVWACTEGGVVPLAVQPYGP